MCESPLGTKDLLIWKQSWVEHSVPSRQAISQGNGPQIVSLQAYVPADLAGRWAPEVSHPTQPHIDTSPQTREPILPVYLVILEDQGQSKQECPEGAVAVIRGKDPNDGIASTADWNLLSTH